MLDTAPTLTYHGDPAIKARAVESMRSHRAADELVKGHYIKVNGGFTGCAVGCVLRDLAGVDTEPEDPHALYAEVAGLPKWLAHLHDLFFEELPHPANQQFAEDLLAAVPVGVDLTPAYHRFMVWLLTDEENGSRRFADEAGQAATDAVASLHNRAASGDMPTDEEWATARATARATEWATERAAARAAARAAEWAAEWATASAAARAAASAAAWAAQSKALIRILAEAAQ